MATDRDFVDYVLDQSGLGEALAVRKMFGEYAFYLDGKVVAFACDNSFFLKPIAAVRAVAPALPERPLFPGSKPYLVADELLDDSDTLRRALLETAKALPPPRPRKAGRGRGDAKRGK
ncbi:TfoX/Sxy family protein [Fulvimonas soli]|jgi:TfoX/Sxy family transcriptional regulator of competence genes|uniref:TfoX/Sxy family transcriptional regulator of competence genes n=1 Tax=Fulvimonas soli TaxID=155197 RepID=A0A316IF73_9GAMM|nr:TfoX/Sxy family protein [Fulvimonas soli]PWK92052.1 TfoX/Sxy family transcriptional regulator of competence genes [Fulvimonas soli]TNY25225.1 TfoX domain-containing protein [Fulvimonas soli]